MGRQRGFSGGWQFLVLVLVTLFANPASGWAQANPPTPFPASELALAGSKVCACPAGDSGRPAELFLDQRPVPTTRRADGVLEVVLPRELAPGRHVLSTSPTGDYAVIEVLAVATKLDREQLRRGGKTTLGLEILGSARPLPLEFVNNSPEIVSLEGGNRVYLQTSGGERNRVSLEVKARRQGDFDLQWQLGLPPCPCDPEVAAATFTGASCPRTDLSCLQPRPAPVLPTAVTWKEEGTAAAVSGRDSRGRSWKVVLGKGWGETRIHAVATLSEREVVAYGWTTARKLWGLSGWNQGGRDGFVARIDPRSGKLLGGGLVGCPGNQEITGVTADTRGQLMVVGTSDRAVPNRGKELGTITQTLPAAAASQLYPAFASQLGKGGKTEVARRYLGELPVKRPRIWIDCQGVPVIGAPTFFAAECVNPQDSIYEQSQFSSAAFAASLAADNDPNGPQDILGKPPGGWGFHALRWKEQHQGNVALTWPLLADEPSIPRIGVSCSDKDQLNHREGAPTITDSVFVDSSNQQVDPGGFWECGAKISAVQLAVHAAFLMNEFGTPVYTDFRYHKPFEQPGDPPSSYSGAIERVRFHPICPYSPTAYGGQKLDQICNFGPAGTTSQLTCSPNPLILGVSGPGFHFRFEEMTGSKWFPYSWFIRPTEWSASPAPGEDWYFPGDYVYDPPEGSEVRLDQLRQLSREVANRTSQRAPVLVTRREPGLPACAWRQTADIPLDP